MLARDKTNYILAIPAAPSNNTAYPFPFRSGWISERPRPRTPGLDNFPVPPERRGRMAKKRARVVLILECRYERPIRAKGGHEAGVGLVSAQGLRA